MYRRVDVNSSKYVNSNVYLRTIKVEGRISREDVLRRLDTAGVNIGDIEGLYREGENSPWHAVLRSQEKAKGATGDGIKYIANLIVDLRIHWLPLFINDSIIKDVLKDYGEILEITKDKTVINKDTIIENGTRTVKLRTTEFDSRNIPHIVSLGTCGMLITMKGRPPICLRCRQTGHLRKDCPEKVQTYATVVNNQGHVAPQLPTPRPLAPVIEQTPPTPSTPASIEGNPVDRPTNPTSPDAPQMLEEEVNDKTDNTSDDESAQAKTDKRELFDLDTYTWQAVSSKRSKKAHVDKNESSMEIQNS